MLREEWNKKQVEDAINYIRDNFIFVESKYPGLVKYNQIIFKKINDLYPNMFCSIFEIYKLVTVDNPWNLFCPICSKRNKPNHNYCSIKCAQNDKIVKDKAKETLKKLYGDSHYNNKEQQKRTCLKLYGVENVFQNKEKIKKACETKLRKYGNPKYTNPKKMTHTKLTKMNEKGENIFQQAAVKAQNTMLKRYGVKTPMEKEIFAERQKQVMEKKYGVRSSFQMDSVRKKIKAINKSKQEALWLDNLQVPNDKEHRQVYLHKKRVDGIKGNIIYEFLGDFWHGNPTLINNYIPDKRERYKIFFATKFKKTKERFDFLVSLGYTIVYCWQSDFILDNNFYREYKGVLEYD